MTRPAAFHGKCDGIGSRNLQPVQIVPQRGWDAERVDEKGRKLPTRLTTVPG